MAWGTKLMAWAPLAEGKNGLFAMQDKQYAAFQAKLTPGVPVESFIGIRVPVLRKFTKNLQRRQNILKFQYQ